MVSLQSIVQNACQKRSCHQNPQICHQFQKMVDIIFVAFFRRQAILNISVGKISVYKMKVGQRATLRKPCSLVRLKFIEVGVIPSSVLNEMFKMFQTFISKRSNSSIHSFMLRLCKPMLGLCFSENFN